MLKPGDIFKTVTGDVWYVEHVSLSRAHCIHLSAHPTPITTRKGVTKVVKRHLRNSAFSLDSIVDLVDRNKLDSIQLRKRLAMARKNDEVEAAAEGQDATASEHKAPAVSRVASKYSRTDKAPEKELRGQAKEVFDAMNSAGGPLTNEEIAARCVFAGSRQDKVRVAAFYTAQFKKKGLVKVEEAPAAEPVSA